MTKSFTLSLGKVMEEFDNLHWVFPQKYDNSERNETGYSTTINLPGYNRDNLKVTVENKRLIIRSKKEDEKGVVLGSLCVTSKVDTNSISCKIEDGVLSVVMPLKKQADPEEIKIE
ncbi:HSP20 family small heat-shock protein [Verrucomicrobia bacterium]|nr:HSP20 family small heat-shock protein [bacterium]MDB4795258.1 HSP20 family small heat-shock protein [Verrucomicrobiota bacterium]MDC0317820.1 HSP20 family small heat-shock protein [bacterium]